MKFTLEQQKRCIFQGYIIGDKRRFEMLFYYDVICGCRIQEWVSVREWMSI